MIGARDKAWNSATTLYIARKLEALAAGRKLKVLDLGCGGGTVLRQMADYGHEFYGCDINAPAVATIRKELGERLPEERIQLCQDERTLPFPDKFFDVIYANQVFEHIKFLDCIFGEAARILRPDGALINLFPLASYPVEMHIKLPFAHWIPPGRLRTSYFRLALALRLRPKRAGMSAKESAIAWDKAIQKGSYYRFINEIEAVSDYHFKRMECDTSGYIRAKIDLLRAQGLHRRLLGNLLRLANGRALEYLVMYGFGATFVHSEPRR